jgi:dTDP-4-dehydrorhamnose reductase
MKILITGINGQVGHALMQKISGHDLIGLTRQDFDLANSDQIKKVIDHHEPNIIINSAAYTKVDQAENEIELAYQINHVAPKVMAEKSMEHNIPFIHFSTDYVFDGAKKKAYIETDTTNPLGVYGKSKLAGEEAINKIGGLNYIFRTSWVYSNIGHNFFLTIKRLSTECNELRMVMDQKGVPTSNHFIAEQIVKIIPQLNGNNTGTYHLVPDGSCSWYEFSKLIVSQINPGFNLNNIHSIMTDEFSFKTRRPKNSVLNNDKIKQKFGLNFNDWQMEFERLINGA